MNFRFFKGTIPFLGLLSLFSCSDGLEPLYEPSDNPAEETASPEIRTAQGDVAASEMSKIVTTLFPNSGGNMLSRSGEDYDVSVINDSKGTPAIYVINMKAGGYILVSATKKYVPVLAYNPTGSFNPDQSLPEPVDIWLKNTAEYASGSIELPADSLEYFKKLWKGYECATNNSALSTDASPITRSAGGISYEESVRLREKIAEYEIEWNSKGYEFRSVEGFPDWDRDDDFNKYKQMVEPHIYPRYIYDYYYLTYNVKYSVTTTSVRQPVVLEAKWNQGFPYNVSFPRLSNGARAYTGCTAVAAAQVMYHYKHPAKYDWSIMKPTYDEFSPADESSRAVSNLMLDLALGSNAKFEEDGTGIKLDDMANYLQSIGYNARAKKFNEKELKTELATGRPVIFSCKGNGGELYHTMVMTGGTASFITRNYDQWWTFVSADNFDIFSSDEKVDSGEYTMYHINWGYGGSGDGYYYNISNISPTNRPDLVYDDYKDMILLHPIK